MKTKICIIVLFCISLIFIILSMFIDRATTAGKVVAYFGFTTLFIGSLWNMIRAISENKKKKK